MEIYVKGQTARISCDVTFLTACLCHDRCWTKLCHTNYTCVRTGVGQSCVTRTIPVSRQVSDKAVSHEPYQCHNRCGTKLCHTNHTCVTTGVGQSCVTRTIPVSRQVSDKAVSNELCIHVSRQVLDKAAVYDIKLKAQSMKTQIYTI